MNTSQLTQQLADTKREWEACKKRMDELHKQANKLRSQGANEAQANFLVYGKEVS